MEYKLRTPMTKNKNTGQVHYPPEKRPRAPKDKEFPLQQNTMVNYIQKKGNAAKEDEEIKNVLLALTNAQMAANEFLRTIAAQNDEILTKLCGQEIELDLIKNTLMIQKAESESLTEQWSPDPDLLQLIENKIGIY
jgi:hypothetical protein